MEFGYGEEGGIIGHDPDTPHPMYDFKNVCTGLESICNTVDESLAKIMLFNSHFQ